jgi:hypothetical protein
MSKLSFFNFVNQPTYDYFRWLMANKEVDLKALVAEAFRQTGDDPEDREGMAASWDTRDALAGLLEEQVFHVLPLNPHKDPAPNLGKDYGGPFEGLHNAFAAWAASQIYYHVVAWAVLMVQGKSRPNATDILEIPQKDTDEGEPVAQGRTDPSPPYHSEA